MKIVIVKDCSTLIRGILSRYFIRVCSSTYVSNNLSKPLFDSIIDYIKKESERSKTKVIIINESKISFSGMVVQYLNYDSVICNTENPIPVFVKPTVTRS